jgi:hypothetical protein
MALVRSWALAVVLASSGCGSGDYGPVHERMGAGYGPYAPYSAYGYWPGPPLVVERTIEPPSPAPQTPSQTAQQPSSPHPTEPSASPVLKLPKAAPLTQQQQAQVPPAARQGQQPSALTKAPAIPGHK